MDGDIVPGIVVDLTAAWGLNRTSVECENNLPARVDPA